ncbi:hypothetical protein C8N46_1143 [Kordia periserrulae]|uniref:Uncharacterized protein n=1 Tax=Kordia periserrulae TaxID=701523 RepID=A0A2T6BQL1_9FLAO|nr:hypothetical protein [Kordia periserrulae]PTX58358.1 hypothetical protein C8N46_1143 [Kordia periserrulae]
MKKKELNLKLLLKKQNVASFEAQTVKGGNTADCPPPTLSCNCNPTNDCGTNTGRVDCYTLNVETCFSAPELSCTPEGCGNSLYNC